MADADACPLVLLSFRSDAEIVHVCPGMHVSELLHAAAAAWNTYEAGLATDTDGHSVPVHDPASLCIVAPTGRVLRTRDVVDKHNVDAVTATKRGFIWHVIDCNRLAWPPALGGRSRYRRHQRMRAAMFSPDVNELLIAKATRVVYLNATRIGGQRAGGATLARAAAVAADALAV